MKTATEWLKIGPRSQDCFEQARAGSYFYELVADMEALERQNAILQRLSSDLVQAETRYRRVVETIKLTLGGI